MKCVDGVTQAFSLTFHLLSSSFERQAAGSGGREKRSAAPTLEAGVMGSQLISLYNLYKTVNSSGAGTKRNKQKSLATGRSRVRNGTLLSNGEAADWKDEESPYVTGLGLEAGKTGFDGASRI